MMAKKKKITTTDLAGLGISGSEVGSDALKSEVVEFMASKTRKAGRKFEGDAAKVVAEVVGLLASEAKVF